MSALPTKKRTRVDEEAEEAEWGEDEVEVGEEDEDEDDEEEREEDDEDENENEAEGDLCPLNTYTKEEEKIAKKFGLALCEQAVASEWEAEALARLMGLMMRELDLSKRRRFKFLEKCVVGGKPQVLGTMIDEQSVNLSAGEICSLMVTQAEGEQGNPAERFCVLLEESLEAQLFNLEDCDTIEVIYDITSTNSSFTAQMLKREAVIMCSHAQTKRFAGRILNVFCRDMTSAEASQFVHSVCILDFFYDLTGKIDHLLQEMPEVRQEVAAYIEEHSNLDDSGNIAESDADEHGNLRGFVDNDDDDEEEEEEEDEDDDEDDEGPGVDILGVGANEYQDQEEEEDEEEEEEEEGEEEEEEQGADQDEEEEAEADL